MPFPFLEARAFLISVSNVMLKRLRAAGSKPTTREIFQENPRLGYNILGNGFPYRHSSAGSFLVEGRLNTYLPLLGAKQRQAQSVGFLVKARPSRPPALQVVALFRISFMRLRRYRKPIRGRSPKRIVIAFAAK